MAQWLQVAEVGSTTGIRLLLWLTTALGRGAGRFIVWWVALYYTVLSPRARREVRRFHAHLDPDAGPLKFRAVMAHIRHFAQVGLDRIFLLKGRHDLFNVTSYGREILQDLAKRKQGAIILGAHMGSFEAMRATSHSVNLPLNIVGYFKNAARINRILSKLNPDISAKVLSIAPGDVNFILKLRECIDAGELVAILGDRTGVSGRTVTCDFMGEPAEFPAGPYLLAALLDCPVLLTFGIYRGGNQYDLHCETFAETLKVPRKGRMKAIQGSVQRYADRLAYFTAIEPKNWFNFYNFWAKKP